MLRPRILAGICAVCAANLLLEVSLTRIFSALMFYHFTFFAIALALLGMGASGVYVYVRSDRFSVDTVDRDLARNAHWFAAATLVALVYVLANPVVVYVESGDSPRFTNISFWQLVLLCGVTAVPFFFSGMVVSLAITHYRRAIDRVYFFDLLGAGGAALTVGLLLGVFGGPGLVTAVACLACGAAALFSPSRRAVTVLAAACAVVAIAVATPLFAPPSTKTVRAGRVVFDAWNTFSRVTVEAVTKDAFDIRIDAAARTRITSAADAHGPAWEKDVSALAYHFHPGGAGSALIIGPGGGIDVAHALASGVRRVIGVDINPLIATDIMRDRFRAANQGLYLDPRVTIEVDEGRSFIRRSPERYDVIQATLVDTWAATASGAFALTENTLYTVEAFLDYYDHLTDDGIVTMSRWWMFANAPETLRLVLLAEGALERGGVAPADARKHLYLARRGNLGTLIVKRNEMTPAQVSHLDEVCARSGFDVILSPTRTGDATLGSLVDAGAWSERVQQQPMDLTPPTDDRPFFFYSVKPAELWSLRHFVSGQLANPAVWLLGALGAMLIALTGVFVFVPLFLRRWADLRGGDAGAPARRVAGLGYFAAIGFGFMVLEIALMQRLSLFLGHPSYSLVVVLFAILVGTALGARWSKRLVARAGATVLVAGVVIAALAAVAGVALAPALRALIAMPLVGRMALAAAIVMGFGLLMGVMLPLGVRLLAERDAAIVPWAWGINGGMSVIGTVGATVIAINGGFTATFVVGAALYAAAGVIGATLARRVART